MNRKSLTLLLSLGMSASHPPRTEAGVLKALALTFLPFSKTSEEWIKKYPLDNATLGTPMAYDIAPLSNEGFLATGNYGNHSFIGVLNSDGVMTWSQAYTDRRLQKVVTTPQGAFYLVGKMPYIDPYSEISALLVMKGTLQLTSNPPLLIDWEDQALFAFSIKINDASASKNDSVSIVGDAYGALTDNTTFSLIPKGFFMQYLPSGEKQNSTVIYDKNFPHNPLFAGTILDQGHDIITFLGTKIPDLTLPIPTMYLAFLENIGPSTQYIQDISYLMIEAPNQEAVSFNPQAFDNTIDKGFIPLTHIKTSKNTYLITGINPSLGILSNNTLAYRGKNTLFAMEVNATGTPLWTRILEHHDLVNAAGFGLREAPNGDYLISGNYRMKNNTQHAILLRLHPLYCNLLSATSFTEKTYDMAFVDLHIRSDNTLFIPGFIKKNNDSSIALLLAKIVHPSLQSCGQPLAVNFSFRYVFTKENTENIVIDPLYTLTHNRSQASPRINISLPITTLCQKRSQNPTKKNPINPKMVILITLLGTYLVSITLFVAYMDKYDKLKPSARWCEHTCRCCNPLNYCRDGGCCSTPPCFYHSP